MDRSTLLYLKWITIKDLLYNMGNSAQCYVTAWVGGEFGGESVSSVGRLCPTLQPHGLQHARPPCPTPISGVYSNSCPLSQ